MFWNSKILKKKTRVFELFFHPCRFLHICATAWKMYSSEICQFSVVRRAFYAVHCRTLRTAQKPYIMITTKRSASQSIIGHRAIYASVFIICLFANELPVTVLDFSSYYFLRCVHIFSLSNISCSCLESRLCFDAYTSCGSELQIVHSQHFKKLWGNYFNRWRLPVLLKNCDVCRLNPSLPSHTVWLLRLKVKGRDIYIPPLTGKPWPAAVYNAKWRTDRQWHVHLLDFERIN